ncbi:MAG TPA: alpha/beta fold hydrolase, partial [Burkholderiales bacterium]|nr:alpha/beta fold hydrolase [Burkholderiales bacterium]
MQLIQYSPTTEKVWKTPLLIIPPWINKYYILDLREKNSFIRWAVAQGHTVFVVSWVNPDERLAHKTFDDYMLEGPVAALDAIEQATGEKEANVIGYCLGGTLLACTLAWLGIKGRKRIKSATFFTAMIDFSEPGELGVFVDDKVLANLEKKMAKRGYLEGSEMATTFNLLRANDLIWSFVVNNYLLGKEPFPFDLLFWNSDSTRMPAKMHRFYLRNMYIRNALIEPGGFELAGEPIDLDNVQVPACFVSTVEDHIAPWKSTYLGAKRLPGQVKFILGGSGHIAGIVNPPAANKYHYWTSDKLADTADEWLLQAERRDGSWWTEWNAWVSQFGGEKVPARVPGSGKLRVIEDAPGSYVKMRLDAQSQQHSQRLPTVANAAAPAAAAAQPASGAASPARFQHVEPPRAVPEASKPSAKEVVAPQAQRAQRDQQPAKPAASAPARSAKKTKRSNDADSFEDTIDLLSSVADAQPAEMPRPAPRKPKATRGTKAVSKSAAQSKTAGKRSAR